MNSMALNVLVLNGNFLHFLNFLCPLNAEIPVKVQ